MPFMTKQLSKEAMKRSRLRNNFLGNRTEGNKIIYDRHRNVYLFCLYLFCVYLFCVSLLQKSKAGYYENLTIKNVTDKKLLCKLVKPLLSDKLCTTDRINISEKGEILKTMSETRKTLNSFFSNVANNLSILRYREFDPVTENIGDPTL